MFGYAIGLDRKLGTSWLYGEIVPPFSSAFLPSHLFSTLQRVSLGQFRRVNVVVRLIRAFRCVFANIFSLRPGHWTKMAAVPPDSRFDHESALIGDDLYVFGGRTADADGSYFPRHEIWTCNVYDKKWICRVAEGDEIPPPCEGAQCVVIDGIIYSYGGKLNKWDDGFEEVFGLNPKNIKWIRVATPVDGKKPWKRYEACLWAIGGRFIMFGGGCLPIPPDRLQSGAEYAWKVNNELYEFVFKKNREKG